jgi:hypothetical protein
VPAAQHAPQLLIDIVVETRKGCRCIHMAVVVTPAAKHLIEPLDQGGHRCADVCTDQIPHPAPEGHHAVFRRRDVQCCRTRAQGMSEEAEAVLDVANRGLLVREFQTALREERFERVLTLLPSPGP